MPKFPTDLERPYGSLCGEGFSETPPPASDLLTVIPALRRMFVAKPLQTAELIEAYLPISPAPPRRCNMALYSHIENGLGVCVSYCAAFKQTLVQPGFLMWWFFQECDLVLSAIGEEALALGALQKEIERIYPPAKEDATAEDRVRPIMSALNRDLLEALARTMRGTDVLLAQCKVVLENTEDDPSALGVVMKPIMSLKPYWEPVFGNYKNVAAAVKKNKAVPQRQKGRRFLVDVAAFLSWLDTVKDLSAGNRINPSSRATWTEEFWDEVSKRSRSRLI